MRFVMLLSVLVASGFVSPTAAAFAGLLRDLVDLNAGALTPGMSSGHRHSLVRRALTRARRALRMLERATVS
jgi:hypothetical protein